MHGYFFNIGDYSRDTKGLTPQQHGLYRLMLDLMYATEAPLPSDPVEILRLLGFGNCKSRREDVFFLEKNLFTCEKNQLVHKRVLAYIKRARDTEPARKQVRADRARKQARYRALRAAIFKALGERGAVMPWNSTMRDLWQTVDKLGIRGEFRGLGNERLSNVSVSPNGLTINQFRAGNAKCGEYATVSEPARETAGFIQSLGIPNTNPHDERLLHLLAQGIPQSVFQRLGVEAQATGKGWRWVLDSAAARLGNGSASPQNAPGSVFGALAGIRDAIAARVASGADPAGSADGASGSPAEGEPAGQKHEP